ncbi:hypothetical protein [Streptomyces sp. NPDC047009]|uniref:hypothetical protein n=1 Tax=Streptomyces sp. NPDC047009 TaxID=3154496 RepID=UPI0033FAAF70
MSESLDYPPPGITQSEWAELSTSEKAAIAYRPVPDDMEDDWRLDQFRRNSR